MFNLVNVLSHVEHIALGLSEITQEYYVHIHPNPFIKPASSYDHNCLTLMGRIFIFPLQTKMQGKNNQSVVSKMRVRQ